MQLRRNDKYFENIGKILSLLTVVTTHEQLKDVHVIQIKFLQTYMYLYVKENYNYLRTNILNDIQHFSRNKY